MYRKVIVPLDGSEEAEKVVPILRDILTPGGEVVLLRVVVAMEARTGGEHDPVFDSKMQESEKTKALEYLHRAGAIWWQMLYGGVQRPSFLSLWLTESRA